MQNNTAIDFLTDQYGFFSTDWKDKDRDNDDDCKYSAGAKVMATWIL